MPGRAPRRAALALLCAAQFVDVLGVTVVVVALPSIGAELGLTGSGLGWVVSIYALCFGGFLILSGRAADRYGRRRLFVAGLALFAGASLACGLAPSGIALIAARALQGLGAALAVPAALSLLTTTFSDPDERTRALAIWTAAAAAGGATGFVVGGPITQGLGWEWVFFAGVPVGVAGVALAPVLLPESRDQSGGGLDLWGAATITAGLLALIFAATNAAEAGVSAPATLTALGLAVALLTAFVRVEGRVALPLLPLRVLGSSELVAANLTAFSLTAVTSSAGVLHTLYVQRVLELSPIATGMAFLPLSVAVIAGSAISPELARRAGARAAMTGGLVLTSIGMIVACAITAQGGLGAVLAGASLSGLGLGLAAVASTSTGTAAARRDEQGLASGLINTSTQVGTALGVAALVTVAAAVTGDRASSEALVEGLRAAYATAAGLGLIAGLTVFRMLGRQAVRT
jgi:EmrB/QacA subfamily drug resistance transporter